MDTGVVENNKESYIGNLVLPIAILGLSAICFIQSLGFPTNEDVGPAAVPFLWIGFTVVFCTALIIQAVLRRGKPDPVSGKIGFVFLFVGWLIVYLSAIELIGYFLSTFIFLVGSMYVLLGYHDADITTTETLPTSTYGDASVNGLQYGLGVKSDNMRLEVAYSDFDSIELASTDSSTQKIKADADALAFRFSYGF